MDRGISHGIPDRDSKFTLRRWLLVDPEYILLSVLISVLPVLIPEIREWVAMFRDHKLEERLISLEQGMQELTDEVARLRKRKPSTRKGAAK